MPSRPLAYFISWTCYGHWLHGDLRGSVDPEHNLVGTTWLASNPKQFHVEKVGSKQSLYEQDDVRREIALKAIIDVARYRGWRLPAVHVRARHVHVVCGGNALPEKMMNDFKVYSSRALNRSNVDPPNRIRWTRHGSAKYIWDESYLFNAMDYVLNKQGEPMQRHSETR